MAKGTTDFARQTTEQAVQTTDWMRAIAEQNLNQSKAALEEFLTVSRNAVRGVDRQAASRIRPEERAPPLAREGTGRWLSRRRAWS